MLMHSLAYSMQGLTATMIVELACVISYKSEPNAESALQAHQVQASHGVPISTIPAHASPGAESGLTGPGLRKLAEVSVKATAQITATRELAGEDAKAACLG